MSTDFCEDAHDDRLACVGQGQVVGHRLEILGKVRGAGVAVGRIGRARRK
jgi:hypothetical protein